jgi:hypothetical protein
MTRENSDGDWSDLLENITDIIQRYVHGIAVEQARPRNENYSIHSCRKNSAETSGHSDGYQESNNGPSNKAVADDKQKCFSVCARRTQNV